MRIVKFTLCLLFITASFSFVHSQSVLDPNDPVINYDSLNKPTQPAWGTIGKWVRTPRFTWWNTDQYKAYIYKGIAFRIKFPKTYNPTANDGKKYPMIAFWHGLLESGDLYDNEFHLYWGGDFFRNAVENERFDGYVIAMQTLTTSGSFFAPGHFQAMKEIIDYMVQNNKLDPFRVTSNGLSSGAIASWQMFLDHPTYVSNIIAMSAPGTWTGQDVMDKSKFTPVWYANGGQDVNPTPYTADQNVAGFEAAGANFRRKFYPQADHNTWEPTWGEPTFWPTVNGAYASNPWALFGKTKFAPGETVSATIGLAPGFDAYEWRKDGVVIPGATGRSIQVTQLGVYDARVKRGTLWSDWSKAPVHIRSTQQYTRIEAENYSAMSNIGTETTSDAGGGQNVGWQDNGDYMDYSVFVNSAGTYTVNFRVATFFNNPQFQLRKADGTVLTTMTVPHTSDWQKFVTITGIVNLPAGLQTLRIVTTSAVGGWNINWWEIDGGSNLSAAVNQSPTANAGNDTTITLPTNTMTLKGSGSDPDGTIASYAWTKISGPANGTIATPTAANSSVAGLEAGVYVFRLTVTDNAGAPATDDITVTVNGTAGPSAGNIKIQAENYVNMSGIQTEGTSDVGGGLNVGWQDNGDWMDYAVNLASGGTFTANFRVASYFTGAQFQVRNSSGTVLATVTVPNTGGFQNWATVSAALTLPPGAQTLRLYTSNANGGWNINWWEIVGASANANTPPTADAGSDMIVNLPNNSVALNATGTDTDGSIVAYSWSKVSGPASSTIATPNAANTNITNLVAGTYVFRVTVTDNSGATATDDVTVTVQQPSGTFTKIQAENYSSMSGIQTESTNDVGGGLNVGWQDTGDWMNYSVTLSTAGLRTVNFRVASYFTGAQFQLRNAAGTVLATVTVPNTGSFQNWTTISTQVTLPAGTQTLRLYTSNANGGWNINWWEIQDGMTGGRPGIADPITEASKISNPLQIATDVEVSPNPVRGNFQLAINNELTGVVRVQLVNATGMVVRTFTVNKTNAGTWRTTLSADGAGNGVYFIQANMKGWSGTKRIVKQ